MPTLVQLLNNHRQPKIKRTRRHILAGNPQRRGGVLAVRERTPRKPNSARRDTARVRVMRGGQDVHIVSAYIPGEGHTLSKHSSVLVRGGRAKDLPGVQYKLVRGKFDLREVLNRRSSRSKYGVKLVR